KILSRNFRALSGLLDSLEIKSILASAFNPFERIRTNQGRRQINLGRDLEASILVFIDLYRPHGDCERSEEEDGPDAGERNDRQQGQNDHLNESPGPINP